MAKYRKRVVGNQPPHRNNRPLIFGGIGVVVVLAVIAIVVTATHKDTTTALPDNVSQWQSVSTTGAALAVDPSTAGSVTDDTADGAQAPELHGETFAGDPVNVVADGRPKVVMFFAHWCPHCQREMPLISQWLNQHRNEYPKVDFVAIATDTTSPDDPKARAEQHDNFPPSPWFTKNNYPLPVMADNHASGAATAFGLSSFPYLVFLDGQDKVVVRAHGEVAISDFEQLVKKTAATAP